VTGTVEAFNFIRRVGFPATPEVASVFTTISLLSALISLPLSGESLIGTLVFAITALVGPAILAELLNSALVLRKDKVLNFRRLMGLELVSMMPLFVVLPLSSLIGLVVGLPGLWVDGFLIGLILSLPIRFLTTVAISSMRSWRKLLAATITPLLTARAYFAVTPVLAVYSSLQTVLPRALVSLFSGLALSALGVLWIVKNVDTSGGREIGDSPMQLFRAFLDHWLSSKPQALEDRLDKLGTQGSIETKILSFARENSRPKASIIVSNFHPGPYRNLGSGGLPSELKQHIEYSVGGVVQVPHGISNHQLNIISRDNIRKILDAATENYPSQHKFQEASGMIREKVNEAKVTGQAFANVVLLTITLAPVEMEDLPASVLEEIEMEASKKGFHVLTIDAHNSITGQTSITPSQARSVVEAAVAVLGRLEASSRGPFKAGAAEDTLSEFALEDGIGPGGLSALALQREGEVAVYLTIDGNNMVTGFRERILESLRDMGVSDGEIMTTDTHLVTGLARSELGYYPVGAHVSEELLIRKIKRCVQRATADLERSSAGLSEFSLRLQVLGSDTFESITNFIGRIAGRIGRQFFWLEASALALGLLVLALV
jgi:putative membrane protein